MRRKRILASLCGALAAGLFAFAAPAGAETGGGEEPGTEPTQTETADPSDEPGGTSDRPEAAEEDTIHGGWLVLASYIILWLLVLGYVVYLGVRQRRLAAEIDELEARVDETVAAATDED